MFYVHTDLVLYAFSFYIVYQLMITFNNDRIVLPRLVLSTSFLITGLQPSLAFTYPVHLGDRVRRRHRTRTRDTYFCRKTKLATELDLWWPKTSL